MNTNEHLAKIVDEINSNFKDSFVNKTQQISDFDFLLTFSKNSKKNLIISINTLIPFIVLSDMKFLHNQVSTFFNVFKNKLSSAHFINAELLNNDNIVCLNFVKTTDTYDRINLKLIIELFKSNSNIIIVQEEKIISAYRYKSLDTNHPTILNLKYSFPQQTSFFKEFDKTEEDKLNNYLSNIDNLYLKEKYKSLISLLKRKKKSSIKKLGKIQQDNNKAHANLFYKEYGDYLMINLDKIKKGDHYFKYEGNTIPLNENLTPSQNLEKFYKTYKKAKITIQSTEKYINETENDIKYCDSLLSSIENFNEQEYEEILYELNKNNFIKVHTNKSQKQIISSSKPCYIFYENTKIGFGKNNIQNDQLSFKYANSENYFLHILNEHGPHIIIFDNNPKNEVIQFACELSIYLANKSVGDVVYTQVKNLKKTGTIGLVRFDKYETYHINHIRENISDYLKEVNRF